MCGGINARGGAERGARDKKRKRKGRGDEGQVADIAEAGRGAFFGPFWVLFGRDGASWRAV